jgi:hypothetical protein
MSEKLRRRNGDKPLYRIFGATIWGLLTTSVIMTAYVFTNFATIDYVKAEDAQVRKEHRNDMELQNVKLDFIVQNIGKTDQQIIQNRDALEREIERNRNNEIERRRRENR